MQLDSIVFTRMEFGADLCFSVESFLALSCTVFAVEPCRREHCLVGLQVIRNVLHTVDFNEKSHEVLK